VADGDDQRGRVGAKSHEVAKRGDIEALALCYNPRDRSGDDGAAHNFVAIFESKGSESDRYRSNYYFGG